MFFLTNDILIKSINLIINTPEKFIFKNCFNVNAFLFIFLFAFTQQIVSAN